MAVPSAASTPVTFREAAGRYAERTWLTASPAAAARRRAAATYRRLFDEFGLGGTVQLPVERPGCLHVYNQFVIRVPGAARDALRAHLGTCRIGTEIYYPVPLHLQACFASLGHQPGDFPRSESAAQQSLALPIYPELSEEAEQHVVRSIAEFFHDRGAVATF